MALAEFEQMSLLDGTRVVAAERNFDRFETEIVRSRVSEAADHLNEIDDIRSERIRDEVEALQHVVTIVRNGWRLYDLIREVYRRHWAFEAHYYYAEWGAAARHARLAQDAVAQWPSYASSILDELETTSRQSPRSLPNFDPSQWEKRATFAAGDSDTMYRTLRGFEQFGRAWPEFDRGFAELESGNFDAASDAFEEAATHVDVAESQFVQADANGATAFQSYADPLFERCRGTSKAFGLLSRAATAYENGEPSSGDELRQSARDLLGRTNDRHPLPKPAIERV